MNTKAIYYAFSRMLLPTITVIILALFWSLSPVETFSWILSQNVWAKVLRVILLIAEIFWFYFLYTKYLENKGLENELTTEDFSGNYRSSDLADYVRSFNSYETRYSAKHLKNSKAFIIKY